MPRAVSEIILRQELLRLNGAESLRSVGHSRSCKLTSVRMVSSAFAGGHEEKSPIETLHQRELDKAGKR